MGQLDQPDLTLGVCAREGALGVAEQLGLHEALGDGAAVHLEKRAIAAVRCLMDQAREQALARTGLGEQEHGRIHRGVLQRPLPHRSQRGALGDDIVELGLAVAGERERRARLLGLLDRVAKPIHNLTHASDLADRHHDERELAVRGNSRHR